MFYRNDNLAQGTPEWRIWRRGVIGASDAPTIMGENPWKSDEHLFKEKLGLVSEFGGNAATREGHALEAEARKAFSKICKLSLGPTIIQSGEVPYMAASLDGIDLSNSLAVEIKCGVKSYELTERTNMVPKYYYGQLQHALAILQISHIYFVAYRPDKPLIYFPVEYDHAYIKRLYKQEQSFVARLKRHGHSLQEECLGIPAMR